MFANLTTVKALLGMDTLSASDELLVLMAIEMADRYLGERTGFVRASTEETEYHERVPRGYPIMLKYRYISDVSASYRMYDAADWTTATVTVVDADTGLVIVTSGEEYPQSELETDRPRWFAWRKPIMDIVRLTYTASPPDPVPMEIVEAANALAVYYYQHRLTGNVTNTSIGQVKEQYNQRPIPLYLEEFLAPFDRKRVKWC